MATSNSAEPPSKDFDLLIIGAGIFGTSTAYHLSKTHPTPSRIAVIDRTPFPPDHAASTDINKIIRADYTSPFYMDLAYEAMDAWNTWPELKGKGFYHRTGWIAFSEEGDDGAERIRKNFRDRQHDPTQDVSLGHLRTKFKGLYSHTDFEGFEGAYWNPEAGWCDAGAVTAELMKEAVGRGVQYVTGDVRELLMDKNRISGAKLSNGRILNFEKVLLATGAWTSSLMTAVEDRLSIAEQDRTEAQVTAAGVCVSHFKMSAGELQALKEMPVTIYGEQGDAQPPPANNLLKLTNSHSFTNTITTPSGHKVSVPPQCDQRDVPKSLQDETRQTMTSKLFPQFTSRPAEYWRLCWDAVSPSQDHLITKHPDARLDNLYFAVGGSFHSYKFLPNIGKYVIRVLNDESNGAEKDSHWYWKTGKFDGRGAHEKVYPTRELRDIGR
ncbi:MAG: hypothetical protein M1828_002635 [Chrysothrix sp. TS-e1954]|nr:MAG: hypothetical protein M1828_002635 [Chrysothrix sp. TS-e1954]